MTAEQTYRKELIRLSEVLLSEVSQAVKDEIKAQGHFNTGALYNSVEYQTAQLGAIFQGLILMNDYGLILNEFDKTESSFKQVPFLIDFFKSKGLDEVDAKGAAFGTVNKWLDGDKPTNNSKSFSDTNERVGFIEFAFQSMEKRINELLELIGTSPIEAAVFELINRFGQTKVTISI